MLIITSNISPGDFISCSLGEQKRKDRILDVEAERVAIASLSFQEDDTSDVNLLKIEEGTVRIL